MWQSLGVAPAELRLHRTLVCGQAFRWRQLAPDTWGGVIAQHMVPEHDVLFHFYDDRLQLDRARALLRDYFQLDTSLAQLYERWSADKNFASKVREQQLIGLRVLRQDPVENLFAFICSSNNNISRISSMVNSLCTEYGHTLGTLVSPADMSTAFTFSTFPSIETLSQDGVEERLRALGFGYRAKFIAQSAWMIVQNGGVKWLESLRLLPYADAHAALMTLSGIGPKVADCICLMSLDKIGAIPVDTHVRQIAVRDYRIVAPAVKTINKQTYDHIGESFRKIFGEHAGWAHTVLFCADLKAPSKPGPAPPRRAK
nr:8-oxoguanine glycosylase ogg1 [Polyrhizophydium stewartii]